MQIKGYYEIKYINLVAYSEIKRKRKKADIYYNIFYHG